MISDRLFYGIALFVCSGFAGGLAIYGLKRYVGQAVAALAEFETEVKQNFKEVKKDTDKSLKDVKGHFDSVCKERQRACVSHVVSEFEKLWSHGHRGLEGEGNVITFKK